MHFSTKHRRPLFHVTGLFLECEIPLLDTFKKLVGLLFLSQKHGHIFYPLSLTKCCRFLIAQMRYQGDARFLNGIISSTFERRDKDNLRIGSQNQFRIEIALHANLHDVAFPHTGFHILVEKIFGARDAFHCVKRIEGGEIGELKHCHHDSALNGHLHRRISIWHLHLLTLGHQGKVVSSRHFLLILLRVGHIHQSYTIIQQLHSIALGIYGIIRHIGIGGSDGVVTHRRLLFLRWPLLREPQGG